MNDMGIDSIDDISLLYEDYIIESRQSILEINQTLGELNREQLEKKIHNFKGVSANLYVLPVFEKLSLLDQYLKDTLTLQTLDSHILESWAEIQSTFSSTVNDLLNYFRANQVMLNIE